MQTNLLWTGREYYSLEKCLIDTTSTCNKINSTIIGQYQGTIYKVEYLIRTNEHWETLFLKIDSRHSDQHQVLTFEGDAKGNWTRDGKRADQFKGCINVVSH